MQSSNTSDAPARISRRSVVRMGLALPAAGLLAACGNGAAAPSPTAGSQAPSKPAPSSAAAPSSSVFAAGPSSSSSRSAGRSAAAQAAAPAATAGGTTAGSCVLTPEATVGPFYIAGEALRKDVTEGQAGVPLQLRLTVLQAPACTPLAHAGVDVWQANARGDYSGFSSAGGGPAGGSPANKQSFLRGSQITDANGIAEFSTIYPGWYPGRAVHIHLRVHVGGSAGSVYSGGHIVHTGQLFFPEDVSDQVLKLDPYSSHTGTRTLQSQDAIFKDQGGATSIPKLTELQSGSASRGYLGTISLVVNPNATPSDAANGGPGGGSGAPKPRPS